MYWTIVLTSGTQLTPVPSANAAASRLPSVTIAVPAELGAIIAAEPVVRCATVMKSGASHEGVETGTPAADTAKACTWPEIGVAIVVSSYSNEEPPATEIGATGAAIALSW